MRRRWTRLRWRLARWLAPETIMADPAPGREAFVVQRSKPGEWPAHQVSIPLDTLDIKIESKPPRFVELELERNPDAKIFYNTTRRIVTVTGSAES